MAEIKAEKSKHITRNIILIIIFLLLPGIRGYQNFQVYQYFLYVALPIAYLIYEMIKDPKKAQNDVTTRLGKILGQEITRSIALSWVLFTALSFFYRAGVFSRSTLLLILGVFMGIQFAGFTITRLLTGHDLMIRTATGWAILGAITNALLLIFVVVGVTLGLSDRLITYGVWPYVAAVVLVGLLSWGGYRASVRKHNNDQSLQ